MGSDPSQGGGLVGAGDIHSFGAIPAPRLSADLLSLVRTGQVYSLEQILEPGIPYWAGHPPMVVAPYVRHGDMPELSPASVGNEITMIPMHGCTHIAVSYTHLRAHETRHDLVCRLLLEKKKKKTK